MCPCASIVPTRTSIEAALPKCNQPPMINSIYLSKRSGSTR